VASPKPRLTSGGILAAFVALIALAAIFATITRSRDEMSRASSQPASPEASLLMSARGAPGDAALNGRFQHINDMYFSGTLKSTPVLWEPRLASIGSDAGQPLTLEGATDGHVILLNPDLEADDRRLTATLCHEMVHVMLFAAGGKSEDHGPAFQEKLRDLLAAGAFEGVIVSDGERAEMKAELDRGTAELDAEFHAIERESQDIEAARPSISAATADSFNERVTAHNRRANEFNDKVAAFNQLAARYNLAIQYPDGLDGARVSAKAPIGGR
jgi:predicted SprT family Zn-dependent metalloprotease